MQNPKKNFHSKLYLFIKIRLSLILYFIFIFISSSFSQSTSNNSKNSTYYIPNAFIPGRGNDPDINTLKLYGPEIKSATLKIFNQWGQCIFASENPKQKGWDGKYKGVDQDPGTYIWVGSGRDYLNRSMQKKGTVILIR